MTFSCRRNGVWMTTLVWVGVDIKNARGVVVSGKMRV